MKRIPLTIVSLTLAGALATAHAARAEDYCPGLNDLAAPITNAPDKDALPLGEDVSADFENLLKVCKFPVWNYLGRYSELGAEGFNSLGVERQKTMLREYAAKFDALEKKVQKAAAKAQQIREEYQAYSARAEEENSVSLEKKVEILSNLIAKEQDPNPKRLEIDPSKDQEQPELVGGAHFEGEKGLNPLLWALGDDPLLKKNLDEAAWTAAKPEGGKKFPPAAMRVLKEALVGEQRNHHCYYSGLDVGIYTKVFNAWRNPRSELNHLFFNSIRGSDPESTRTVEQTMQELQRRLDEVTRVERENEVRRGETGDKLPKLQEDLDGELLSRIFDNMKGRGDLDDSVQFGEWKDTAQASEQLDAALRAAGLPTRTERRDGTPGFRVSQDGRQIFYKKPGEGDETPDVPVLPTEPDQDPEAARQAALQTIANKILKRDEAGRRAHALREAVTRARENGVQVGLDATIRRGGVFGPLSIAPEAYSKEELASKRAEALSSRGAAYSSQRQAARSRYEMELKAAETKLAAEEQRCASEADGANHTEVKASYEACMGVPKDNPPADKPRGVLKKAVADAQTAYSTRVDQIGRQRDHDQRLVALEARQIAATDQLWEKETGRAVVGVRGHLDQVVRPSDPLLQAHHIEEYWNKNWNPDPKGENYEANMAALRKGIEGGKFRDIKGDVQGYIVDHFQDTYWKGKKAQLERDRARLERDRGNIDRGSERRGGYWDFNPDDD